MRPEPAPQRTELAALMSSENTVSQRSHTVEPARAEKDLRENEKSLSAILDHSPNPTYLKDPEGRYLYVNKDFERARHISQEQIQGKRDDEVFPQEQAARYRANDLMVLQSRQPMQFEEVALQNDGPHTSIVHKFPLLDAEGRVYAIGGISTDITERKLAHEALQKSEERFRFLVEGVQDYAIFALDTEGRVVTWNVGAERMKGYSTQEILGKHYSGFFEPRDIESGKPEHELKEAAAKGRFENEGWRVRKDGSRFWGSVIVIALRDKAGMLQGFVNVTRNMSERQQAEEALRASEERFRRYFELGLIGMAMTSPTKGILDVNDELCRILGYERSELLQKTWAEMTYPDDLANDMAQFNRMMAGEIDSYTLDKRWIRKDGRVIDSIMSSNCVRRSDGSVDYLVGLILEITERKRFEEELKHQRDQLRLVLDLNKSFASTLDLAQLFRALSVGLRNIMRSDAAVLWLPEPENGEVRVHTVDFPEGKGFLNAGLAYPMNGSIPGRVIQTSKPFLFGALPAWLNPELRAMLTSEGLNSGCALPLSRDGAVLGILSLACFRENAFTEQDVELLGLIADQVAIAVENALRHRKIAESTQRLEEERLYLEEEIRREHDFGEIVGKGPALKNALRQVRKVAATDSTVLILGETGTGKELVARAIHNLSSRRDRTFVSVNCASIPAGLLESELFGHEKGAFTGAVTREIGRVELANKGTLFLDEVGDIPLELQSKLLRVLQEREFERLGSTRAIHADFHLVAATHRDLAQMVGTGAFRSDLYYRLNIFPIEIPPLRQRREDIPLLVWHFVKKYAQRMNKKVEKIRSEDMEALIHYSWPGNVRELQNIIERSVILTEGSILHQPLLAESKNVRTNAHATARTLAEAEREHILHTLRDTDWVIGGPEGAAARLAVRRTTLLYKMRRLGIFRPGDSRTDRS
jgi:formate hydrogenlyase transcriptional activator